MLCHDDFDKVGYSYSDNGELYPALEDINLEIGSGEFVCLVGHSGCGKSTMPSLIAGLARPTSGTVFVDEKPVEGPGPDRSVVFQSYSLFPWQKALKNVSFAFRQTHAGVSKEEADARALDLLRRVGVADAANGCKTSACNIVVTALDCLVGLLVRKTVKWSE